MAKETEKPVKEEDEKLDKHPADNKLKKALNFKND